MNTKKIYFAELPTQVPNSYQRIFFLQIRKRKRGILHCPAENTYYSISIKLVKEIMNGKIMREFEITDEESFNKIWNLLSKGEIQIESELIQMFMDKNKITTLE